VGSSPVEAMYGALTNSTIASGSVCVKSTFLGDRTTTKTYSRLKPFFRPDVLSKMPLSCNLVYDLLRTLDPGNGVVRISQRDLAAITRYSKTQVRRSLRRLQGANILRLAEKGKGQRKSAWYLRWNSHKSFPQISGPLTIREVKKELKPTKDKSSFSIEPFKNIPKTQHLNQADKRRLSFVARDTCQPKIVSPVLDILWQRDCAVGIWLVAIKGLQNVTIDEQATEMLWRSRKAIAALIGGVTVDKYQAIMLGKSASEEEAVQCDLAEIDRRLQGLRKWANVHGVTSWFVEKRSELTRQRYEVKRCLPSGICTDGLLIDFTKKPVQEPRRPRAKVFHSSAFYTAKRKPLQGEELEEKRTRLKKALMSRNSYTRSELVGACSPLAEFKDKSFCSP